MFLEYAGAIYEINDDEIGIPELWFTAKNHLKFDNPLVQIWKMNRIYGCEYDKEIMEILKASENKLYVAPS